MNDYPNSQQTEKKHSHTHTHSPTISCSPTIAPQMINPLFPILGGVFGVFAYTLLLPHRDIYSEKAFIHTREHLDDLIGRTSQLHGWRRWATGSCTSCTDRERKRPTLLVAAPQKQIIFLCIYFFNVTISTAL